jgi:hypothetical protein
MHKKILLTKLIMNNPLKLLIESLRRVKIKIFNIKISIFSKLKILILIF